MDRRGFLYLGASAALARLGSVQAADSQGVRRTTQVVARLKRVSLERRQRLARNPQKQRPADLNRLIPEIDAMELRNGVANARPGDVIRLIAWNTERGRYWRDGVRLVREHPALRNPDIIFLGEMDHGMARSANAHTTREMAAALGMNYVYGVEFLEFTGGEPQEREQYPGANVWGYHGNAILSRFPLRDLRMLRFPGIEKWYADYQHRLGGRIALLARVDIGGRAVTLVCTHLESSRDDSEPRRREMDMIVEELRRTAVTGPVLLGGDLNALPDEPLFESMRSVGLDIEGCNDLTTGTSQKIVDGKFVLSERHIDYLAVRGVRVARGPNSPAVVPALYPPTPEGKLLGDHAIVSADVIL